MKKSQKSQQKSLNENQYLNDFHKESTEALLKEVDTMSKQPFSLTDFENQVQKMQPNGKHKQRKFYTNKQKIVDTPKIGTMY
jgi:hypothetical protein